MEFTLPTSLVQRALARALRSLTPLRRKVLELRRIDDLSLEVVAAKVHKTVENVKVIEHRAIDQLLGSVFDARKLAAYLRVVFGTSTARALARDLDDEGDREFIAELGAAASKTRLRYQKMIPNLVQNHAFRLPEVRAALEGHSPVTIASRLHRTQREVREVLDGVVTELASATWAAVTSRDRRALRDQVRDHLKIASTSYEPEGKR